MNRKEEGWGIILMLLTIAIVLLLMVGTGVIVWVGMAGALP